MQSPAGTITANASYLLVLRPNSKDDSQKNEKLAIFVVSPQAGARNEPYFELPKGALDASGNATGPIVEKIYQELGLKPRKDELTNLTSLLIQHPTCRQGQHADSVINPAYITPHKPVILWEKRLERKELEHLTGRFGNQGVFKEKSSLRALDYSNFWKAGTRNAELMSAWAMYENLNRKGFVKSSIAR